MFENEVLIKKEDKEEILSHIKKVNEIMEKYAFSSKPSYPTVTVMSRAKEASREAEKWIDLLYIAPPQGQEG